MLAATRSDPLPLGALLPLRAVAITLRFLAPAQPPLFHQPPLTAFLRHLVDSPDHYDLLLAIDTPESGRTCYRSGDRYTFTLFAFPESGGLLQTVLTKLRALPDTAKPVDPRAPFRDNLVFCEARDLFWGHGVRSAGDLYAYTLDDLAQEAERWRQMAMVRLRWLSPVRLLREKDRREGEKGEARFCRTQAQISYPLLADRLHDTFADLLRRGGLTPPDRSPAPPLEQAAADLFWVDCRYRGERGDEQVMGGLMGAVDLAGFDQLPTADRALWVLGQYYGVGQRRAFGWGRYVLETLAGEVTYRRASPATSILERVADPDNLGAAYDAIDANRSPRVLPDMPEREWDGSDAETDGDTEGDEGLAERLERLAVRLASERYQPPPLRGSVLRKPDGGLRALAIPPFLDRVAQRAVAQILSPGVDPLMYHGSFGYRPRRSRQSAKQMIQAAYHEGYRWVYESDIDDFFDSVDWTRLHNRLTALYGDDPVVDLIMAWMAAPVDYQARRIQRTAGLPQGSPLSPLLANLMLDDFDSDLEAMGFRLARFADDFVILCKNREEAEAAAGAAVQSLAEIGLRINQDKTAIRSFDQGFRYLGYLFVNSLALDVGGQKKLEAETDSPPPSASWLARLHQRTPQAIGESGQVAATVQTTALAPPVEGADRHSEQNESGTFVHGEQDESGSLVLVTGSPALLTLREGRLHLSRDGRILASLPWADVRAIVLFGPHTITTPALVAAMRRGAPVHFATAGGRYQGTAWNGQPGVDGPHLWLRQQACFADPAKAVAAARSLVDARLRHMHEVVRQRIPSGCGLGVAGAMDSLKRSLNALPDVDSLNVLNGLEGQATRAYCSVLKALVPAPFGFEGRNRRPPQDPFNALLSLGYTLLFSHVDTMLRADGLLPWLGFYHRSHGSHLTLASDLMEPFRHLVERTALTAVTRHRLKPEDFHFDAEDGCRLNPQARKRYLALLSERFDTPITAWQGSEPKKMVYHLHDQNRSLIAWINGQVPDFAAWRMR